MFAIFATLSSSLSSSLYTSCLEKKGNGCSLLHFDYCRLVLIFEKLFLFLVERILSKLMKEIFRRHRSTNLIALQTITTQLF